MSAVESDIGDGGGGAEGIDQFGVGAHDLAGDAEQIADTVEQFLG